MSMIHKSKEEIILMSVEDLWDFINGYEDIEPEDQRTVDYKKWKKCINICYAQYNKKIGWRAFKALE